LISLFLKIYQKYNKLCSQLIDTFREINDKENTDRDKELANELDNFNNIYLNAKNIIEENKYDPISFYGIIFCFLSSYDKENFSKIIKEFSEGFKGEKFGTFNHVSDMIFNFAIISIDLGGILFPPNYLKYMFDENLIAKTSDISEDFLEIL